MALNASGVMRLSGSVAGSSLALELGLAANSTVSLASAGPRALAGIASGAIRLGADFYGKSSGPSIALIFSGEAYPPFPTTYPNVTRRFNKCGTKLNEVTTTGATGRGSSGGAVGYQGTSMNVYSGGNTSVGGSTSNKHTRINPCGAIIGTETSGGIARLLAAGSQASASVSLYFGGGNCAGNPGINVVTRFNKCGTYLNEPSTGASGYIENAGSAWINATQPTFAGGDDGLGYYASLFRLNACGGVVSQNLTLSGMTARTEVRGAAVGTLGLFYRGVCNTNKLTRINSSGSLVGTETAVGTVWWGNASASMGDLGMWYKTSACSTSALITRLNVCGALVGTESTAAITAKGQRPSGAGV